MTFKNKQISNLSVFKCHQKQRLPQNTTKKKQHTEKRVSTISVACVFDVQHLILVSSVFQLALIFRQQHECASAQTEIEPRKHTHTHTHFGVSVYFRGK